MTTHLKLKPLLAITLACTLSLLSACGFHLRGELDVSDAKQQLSVQEEQADPTLRRALKRALMDNGISRDSAATYHLTILDTRFSRDSISLDSNARVDEYSLTLKVDFELREVAKNLREAQSTTIEQVYTYDADAAAAKDEQEALLRQEMYDAVATRILRSYLAFDQAQ